MCLLSVIAILILIIIMCNNYENLIKTLTFCLTSGEVRNLSHHANKKNVYIPFKKAKNSKLAIKILNYFYYYP